MKRTNLLLIFIITFTILLLGACNQSEPTESEDENQGYPLIENQFEQGYPVEDVTIDQGYPVVEMPSTDLGYPVVDVISIATDATNSPYEMIDEATKELIGIDIDFIKAVATQLGIQYEFVNLPYDSMMEGLSNCQFDVAIRAIQITDENKELFLFSNPYINAGQVIIVNVGIGDISNLSDLNGKLIGSKSGTDSEIEAQAIDGVDYTSYASYDLALIDLMNGQIEAVIADNPTAMGFIQKNPDKLMSVGGVFNNVYYSIAVCKDRKDLLDKINPALQAIIDTGFIEQLAIKYLTE